MTEVEMFRETINEYPKEIIFRKPNTENNLGNRGYVSKYITVYRRVSPITWSGVQTVYYYHVNTKLGTVEVSSRGRFNQDKIPSDEKEYLHAEQNRINRGGIECERLSLGFYGTCPSF